MAAAAEPGTEAATANSEVAMKRAARFKDQITAAALASVAQNKCEAGVASCGIALPSLSPTEVYTEAGDPGPGLYPSNRAAQGGRRHTMGPASHPLPGLQSPPHQFTLPQIFIFIYLDI